MSHLRRNFNVLIEFKQIKPHGPFSLLFFQLKREKELEKKIAALEAKCEGKFCIS